MADDPLQTFLDRTKLSKAQKAGIWDLYHAAKNTEDLDSRLKTLDLPKEIKADLWDLKSGESVTEAPDAPKPVVSEGYWEDRGIAGKVWHPASGVNERNRADNQVLGVPPELAAIGALRVGGSVAAPAVNAVSRVASGATEVGRQVAPFIKYEVARQVLKHAGLPEPLPTIGGVLAGGYRRGGAATEATTAAEVAETAAAETTPLGFPKPTTPVETPLEFSRRLKAEHQARNIPPFSPPTAPKATAPSAAATVTKQEMQELKDKFFEKLAARPVKVDPEAFGREFKQLAKKPKLTAEEMAIGARELQTGKTAEQVFEMLLKRRELPASFKALPTDAEMAENVAARNATGRWEPKSSAEPGPGSSWIVVSKATGKPVFETFNESTAAAVNREKYDVWSALSWLQEFNKRVKSGQMNP